MTGGILTWTAIAAALGHADAVRMLTAIMLVRTAWTLTKLDTAAALRRRHGASAEVAAKSLRRAIRIEAIGLILSILVLAALIALLNRIGEAEIARMTLLIGIGLPVRHFGPAAGGRRRAEVFRLALTWTGLAMAAVALAAGLDWTAFALILGVREWIALGIALIPGLRPKLDASGPPVETPLSWREVAAITGRRARHRFTYRVGKSLLGVLGPIGNIAARTARGIGAHRRIVPGSAWPVATVAAGATAAAIFLPIALAKPALLLASASLLRVAAAAGNVLLWWRFADQLPDDDEDDEEDD